MGKIRFEYKFIGNTRVVALDAKLEELGFQPVMEDGKLVMKTPERTIKDCRHIDGCLYLHKGRVPDTVMVDLIEKFQKLLKEDGWKEIDTPLVPDPEFKID